MTNNIKCIECGYLFAFSNKGINLENKEFDPEILRELTSEEIFEKKAQDEITNRNYIWKYMSDNNWENVDPYRWGDCQYIGCFRNKFQKVGIAITSKVNSRNGFIDIEDVFDADTSKISAITHTKRDCDAFTTYKIGLTARQHEELENKLHFEQKKSETQWSGQLHQIYEGFLNKVKTAKTNDEKKNSLEYLAEFVFGTIIGLKTIDRDLRTSAEEIDRLIRNESNEPFWRDLGNPVFIECKNWDTPVGASVIRDIKGKMESRNVKTTFLFSKNGITGTKDKDAQLEVRQALAKGLYIITLTLDDLEEIAKEKSPLERIRKAFENLYRI